jgi:hypothetical protein
VKKHKWIFYTDLFGLKRWERLDRTGVPVAESNSGFSTVAEARADAERFGYEPDDASASCRLEWRCEPLPAMTSTDER